MNVVPIQRAVRRRRRPTLRIVRPPVYTLFVIIGQAHDAFADGHPEFVEVTSSWEEAETRLRTYGRTSPPAVSDELRRLGWMVVERTVDQEARCGSHRLSAPARWYTFKGRRNKMPCRCDAPDCSKECVAVTI